VARRRKKTQKHSSAAVPSLPPSTHRRDLPGAGPDESANPESNSSESNSDPRMRLGVGKSRAAPGAEASPTEATTDPVLSPGLYLTATPIGNASDITLRALNVLRNCDGIVAEDTRVTSRLLALYGISRPLLVYNDHNASSMRPRLLDRLRGGARLALVSDAGTPLISDPGHKLVRAACEQGLPVFPVPGASAALAALIISGLPSDRFFFAGFLPPKSGERRTALAALMGVPGTLIFFESAPRLAASLKDMADILGPREGAIARELTKLHEEVRRGTLDQLASHYAGVQPRGEIVALVGPPPVGNPPDSKKIDTFLAQALPFMPVKAAASLVAEATGSSRRDVYLRALALKGEKSTTRDPEA
jgi:16S rRNA (cytidine1402-2'-O)-methyltransferase